MSSEPRVGVGCMVHHEGALLMVRNRGGYWSTPGGNLEFGEPPADCAARETREEAGIRVSNLEFVAVTNDVMEGRGSHYVTIWMRAEADDRRLVVHDRVEVEDAGWFHPSALPEPQHHYFENLRAGRSLPPDTGAVER